MYLNLVDRLTGTVMKKDGIALADIISSMTTLWQKLGFCHRYKGWLRGKTLLELIDNYSLYHTVLVWGKSIQPFSR